MSDLSNLTVQFRAEMNDAGTAAHVSLVGREHNTDGVDCWCKPTIYRVCFDCEDGCWKCDNGKNRITAEEAAAVDEPLLIVHNG